MTKLICVLLTLLFSVSSPALEGNAAFWQSSLAAKNAFPKNPSDLLPKLHLTKPRKRLQTGSKLIVKTNTIAGEKQNHGWTVSR